MFFLLLLSLLSLPVDANPIMQYPNEIEYNELIRIQKIANQTKMNTEITITSLNHTEKSTLENIIQTSIPESTIIDNQKPNILIMSHPKNKKKKIKKIIQHYNKPEKMIKIKCSVYEVSNIKEKDLNLLAFPLEKGIETQFPYSRTHFINPSDIIRTTEKSGQSRIISQPTITIANNEQGHLIIGDKIPYLSFTYHEKSTATTLKQLHTGVNLAIKPIILKDNRINMDLQLTISTIKLWKIIKDNEYPLLSSREINSLLTVENKKSILIGGFINQNKTKNQASIPLLSRLPLIKSLISHTKKESTYSAIHIYLEPEIIE
ncbi:hypothetical protein DID78_02735 [Candidatus Marinamargulisbacteria bacterium SCGC AG-343-D04]|nr:hypothetical protein DID78_02735 [Candidatus Marinamargulisbacteria bacterium SCGC AG-343-D04]